jgi:hypothetical protein
VDFPPSWYLIVAMPGAEGDVVVKDIISENENSESDVGVKDERDRFRDVVLVWGRIHSRVCEMASNRVTSKTVMS